MLLCDLVVIKMSNSVAAAVVVVVCLVLFVAISRKIQIVNAVH